MDQHGTFYTSAGVAACRISNPTAPACQVSPQLVRVRRDFFIIMRMNQCFCLPVSEGGRQSVRRRRLEDGGPVPFTHIPPAICNSKRAALEVSGLLASLLPLPPPAVCRFPIAGEAKEGPGKTEREREGRTWFQPSGPEFSSRSDEKAFFQPTACVSLQVRVDYCCRAQRKLKQGERLSERSNFKPLLPVFATPTEGAALPTFFFPSVYFLDSYWLPQ